MRPATESEAAVLVPGATLRASDLRTAGPRRRRMWPLILFVATCLSTFWAGVKHWVVLLPSLGVAPDIMYRWLIVANWRSGLIYMTSVIGILLAHEMGHFIMTIMYGIPASLPYFIPLPISPIGTMGAVIGMAGYRANRRQIFDIGIAGPLAGLAVIVPVLWLGIVQLDLSIPRSGGVSFDCPWAVRLMIRWLRPELPEVRQVWVSQLNPAFMAAWVGLLVTGLNMLPVSQLDGGHVIYALLKGNAYWVARAFLLAAMVYVVWAEAHIWLVMVILVTLIGVDHPPTSDDDARLGWWRIALGIASLSIPFLCFPPKGIVTYF